MENDFEPAVGHTFQFRTAPAPGFDGIVDCEVLAVDPPRRLSFTWRGGPINTIITFTLEEVREGTRLVVEQTGFVGLKAVVVSFILQTGNRRIYEENLPAVLDQLAAGTFRPKESRSCDDGENAPARAKALAHLANVITAGRKGENQGD
jgi:uncharacterized protein YndB with AHSA1/START domain